MFPKWFLWNFRTLSAQRSRQEPSNTTRKCSGYTVYLEDAYRVTQSLSNSLRKARQSEDFFSSHEQKIYVSVAASGMLEHICIVQRLAALSTSRLPPSFQLDWVSYEKINRLACINLAEAASVVDFPLSAQPEKSFRTILGLRPRSNHITEKQTLPKLVCPLCEKNWKSAEKMESWSSPEIHDGLL